MTRALIESALVYCRVGPCIMLLPGFGHQQIPRSVRGLISLVLAVAISRAIPEWLAGMMALSNVELMQAATGEVLVGLMFGLSGRLVLSAIESFGAFISTMIGLSANLGIALDSDSHAPAFATICTLMATLAVISSDAHLGMIRSLAGSYKTVSIGNMDDVANAASYVVECLSEAFRWGLALSGPFLIVAAYVNMMLIIAGKIMPQLQIFFMSGPILIGAALLMMQWIGPQMLESMLESIEFAVPMSAR